ncbi:MAG TPA: hypothetical protein VF789_28565 [Thermoanaerobaculia bacterium]
MRRIERTLPLLVLLAFVPAAHGASCALDGGPAATLLLPYFEVDLDNPNARTTLFSVNNASNKATLSRVTLWTDMGIPTLAFDLYLTGYDVQTVNLRDIFVQGTLPRTADLVRDPGDTISNRGDLSQDISFPGCTTLPPPPLPASFLDHVRNAHTGKASAIFNGKCSGLSYRDGNIARGYLTIDVVKSCSLLLPGDTGYFGPDGVVAFDNVLWGDFFYVDTGGNFAQGENLVRLHAEPGRYKAGDTTFYARFVSSSGADAREPLPRVWGTRYATGGIFSGGTDLVVWRDVPWSRQPFNCGTFPAGVPQTQREILIFNEEEQVDLPPPCPILCPPPPVPVPFPVAANRIAVGGPDLPSAYEFGWLRLNLGAEANSVEDKLAQAWVGQVSSAEGRFSVGLEGTALGGACEASRCSEGNVTEVGELCALGPFQAGGAARFRVRPKGCFSSSCTQVFHTGCAVQRTGNQFTLDALFCLNVPENQPVCTPDCGGGGFAECTGGTLAAGSYTARLGDLQVQFTVPSDAFQVCAGSPF